MTREKLVHQNKTKQLNRIERMIEKRALEAGKLLMFSLIITQWYTVEEIASLSPIQALYLLKELKISVLYQKLIKLL